MACKGWLQKRGADKFSSTLKRDKKRFFVLKDHVLSYYANTDEEGEAVKEELKGSIDLEDVKTCRRDGALIHLMTTVGKEKREWVLKANDAADAKRWHTSISQSKPGRASDPVPDPYSNSADDLDRDEQDEQQQREREERRRQEQQQQQRYRQDPEALTQDIIERDEAVRKIEETMQTVNDIYKDLGNLVSDQGAMLDSIESNINSSESHVEDGLDQLEQGRRIQRGKRR
eukprot:m.148419 g.148419  ORF g.148419 m.148419 type:complete len:230 (+) comp30594_c1_seq1:259-948(+)